MAFKPLHMCFGKFHMERQLQVFLSPDTLVSRLEILRDTGWKGCVSQKLVCFLQRSTLEHLGRCRYDGCVRTELTKKLGSDANKFHYVIKVASSVLILNDP